jgi:hypothetical protein
MQHKTSMTLKRPQVKRERKDRRDPPTADLRPGIRFHWKTCGVTIDEWLAGAAGGWGARRMPRGDQRWMEGGREVRKGIGVVVFRAGLFNPKSPTFGILLLGSVAAHRKLV